LSFRNKNLWAVVLGGSSGIGLASAKKLSEAGMNICIIHHDRRSQFQRIEEDFDSIRNNKVKLITLNGDASNPTIISNQISNVKVQIADGKVKVLVHAISKGNLKSLLPRNKSESSLIGGSLDSRFAEIQQDIEAHTEGIGQLSDSDLDITQKAMSTSLIHWVRGLLENELLVKGSRVIALTSEGNKRIWQSYVAIAMAKSCLETLIKYLAKELAPYGITANAIQAGITATPSLNLIPGSDLIKESAIARNPFKRMTLPEDVGSFVRLLCSEDASWINGAIIPVDGGEHFC